MDADERAQRYPELVRMANREVHRVTAADRKAREAILCELEVRYERGELIRALAVDSGYAPKVLRKRFAKLREDMLAPDYPYPMNDKQRAEYDQERQRSMAGGGSTIPLTDREWDIVARYRKGGIGFVRLSRDTGISVNRLRRMVEKARQFGEQNADS